MSHEIQVKLFQELKTKQSGSSLLAEEIASLLNISTDSAYRRIKGEKILSLEEAMILCQHFKISLDNLLDLPADGFLFKGNFLNAESFSFEQYLQNVLQQVKYMCQFKERKMYYLCKDIPLFHHFHFREIAAFKYYFWMKNIIHSPEFVNRKFSLDMYPDEYYNIGKEILNYYNQIDSVELWNIETVNSTMRQIEFYHDSNIFASDEEIYMLYEALEKLVNHLELQATEGVKCQVAHPEKHLSGFQMYFNEIIIMENSILVSLDGTKSAFLVHNVINFLMTRDVLFCESMFSYIRNLVKKSTMISTVSEKERARFFKHLRYKIEGRKQNLKL